MPPIDTFYSVTVNCSRAIYDADDKYGGVVAQCKLLNVNDACLASMDYLF